jgi:hypothetical protein
VRQFEDFQNVDVAGADFWRINPHKFFYFLLVIKKKCAVARPGTVQEALVPIWHVCLWRYLLKSYLFKPVQCRPTFTGVLMAVF